MGANPEMPHVLSVEEAMAMKSFSPELESLLTSQETPEQRQVFDALYNAGRLAVASSATRDSVAGEFYTRYWIMRNLAEQQ